MWLGRLFEAGLTAFLAVDWVRVIADFKQSVLSVRS